MASFAADKLSMTRVGALLALLLGTTMPARSQWHQPVTPCRSHLPARSIAYSSMPAPLIGRPPYFGAPGSFVRRAPVAVYSAVFPSYFPWSDAGAAAPLPFDFAPPPPLPSLAPALRELDQQVLRLEAQGRLTASDASDLSDRIADIRHLEQNEHMAAQGSLDAYHYANLQQNLLSLQAQVRSRTRAVSRSSQSCRRCGNVMTDPAHCCDRAQSSTCKAAPLVHTHGCCVEKVVALAMPKTAQDARSIERVFKDLEALILRYNNAGRLGSFDLDSLGERLAELRYKQQQEAVGGRLSARQENNLRQDLRTVEQEVLSHG